VKDFYVKDASTRENQQITSFFLVASKHLHEVGPGAGIYNRCEIFLSGSQRAHPAGIKLPPTTNLQPISSLPKALRRRTLGLYSYDNKKMYISRGLKRTISFGILALCGAAVAVAADGDHAAIAGRVIITKPLTKRRITIPSYQLRGASVNSQEPEKSRKGVPTIDEFSRVVIYADAPSLHPGTPINTTLRQRNRHFEPEILVIPVGSTVSFPNADPIFHNVFSLSKNKQFDLGYYPAGETRTVKFDRSGLVQVYCHLHADMSAAILVLPTASWTRPAHDGSFSLPDVPPGTYELVVWHRSGGFFRRRVTVSSGETLAIELVIPLKQADESAAPAAATER
jgi:plastocyanin